MTVEATPIGPVGEKDLVSLSEAKAELGVTDSSQDTRIGLLITRVSEAIERVTGIVFAEETVTELRQGTGTRHMALKRRFLSEIVEVQYRGIVQTLADFTIEDAAIGLIYHQGGFALIENGLPFTGNPVVNSGRPDWSIEYTAGYDNPEDVPEVYKMGCLEVIKVLFFGGGKYVVNPAIQSGRVADVSFTRGGDGGSGAGSAAIMNSMITELFPMEII